MDSNLKMVQWFFAIYSVDDNFFFYLFIFQDALPPKEMGPAERHCKMADLVLCLGTR